MVRNIFAVCDLEVDYAYHLMEYLSKKKNIPFEVRVFTNVTTLLEYVRTHPIELLLISEKAICDEIREEQIGQILILSEGTLPKEFDLYPVVYKYQSSSQVLREALSYYSESSKLPMKGEVINKKETAIIGVYSPVGRTMKTSFALTLGQILAKEKAVLYINLEEYSGFEYLLEENFEQNLGDVLYYLRQDTTNLSLKINACIHSMNNLDFLPPVLSPADIQQTSREQWIKLLQEIIRYSNYEMIILDFGDGIQELYRILEQCTRIYMPIRMDPISQAKIRQFENLVQLWSGVTVLEKLYKLRLPYHRTMNKGGGYLNDLIWSELGDYVRELIRHEKEGTVEEWSATISE